MLDNNLLIYLISGLGACGLSLVATPTVRAVSRKFGFVDRPDGGRKAHKTPVALGGGAAVLLAVVGALALVFAFTSYQDIQLFSTARLPLILSLGGGALFIVVLGLVDDVVGLRGRTKLLGQALIVGLLVYAGVKIEGFTVFGYEVHLLWMAIPFSAFWLIGTINAINLIDGIDGLAGSVGMILSLTIASIAIWQGDGSVFEAAIMLALAGALVGFLRYNFAPASIYLGDAGSMFIGLMCGTVAVMSNAKSTAAMALVVPLAVWLIPILDTFAALLRRKLTGRSLFTADRGHMHHSLLVRGWSVRQASLFIALICATTCLSAVLSIFMHDERIAVLTVVAVMIFLVFTQTFGHIEFTLIKNRFQHLTHTLGYSESNNPNGSRGSCVQLQGTRQWSKLWAAIVESAEEYHLIRIKLTLDMPAIHESFYADWESSQQTSSSTGYVWRLTHPLMVDGQLVGQLDLSGVAQKEGKPSTLGQIVQALEFLEPIEDDIRRIREDLQHDQQVETPDSLEVPAEVTGEDAKELSAEMPAPKSVPLAKPAR